MSLCMFATSPWEVVLWEVALLEIGSQLDARPLLSLPAVDLQPRSPMDSYNQDLY